MAIYKIFIRPAGRMKRNQYRQEAVKVLQCGNQLGRVSN